MMQIETSADRFVQDQLQPLLRPSEQLECAAYLTTQTGSGFVSAARARAYWAAFSNQRLFLIEARLGAFRPLQENRGVRDCERGELTVAFWGINVVFRFPDGSELQLLHRKAKLSSEQQFLDVLRQQYGHSPTGQEMQQRIKRRTVWGALLGLALGAAYLAYALYFGKAKVTVSCGGHPGGIQCTLRHEGGGATAQASWNVVAECENGTRAVGHAHGHVRPHQSQQVLIRPAQFEGLASCDKLKAIRVTALKVQ